MKEITIILFYFHLFLSAKRNVAFICFVDLARVLLYIARKISHSCYGYSCYYLEVKDGLCGGNYFELSRYPLFLDFFRCMRNALLFFFTNTYTALAISCCALDGLSYPVFSRLTDSDQ